MIRLTTARRERRRQVLEELREMSVRMSEGLHHSGKPATEAELEAFFQKASELPLAADAAEEEEQVEFETA